MRFNNTAPGFITFYECEYTCRHAANCTHITGYPRRQTPFSFFSEKRSRQIFQMKMMECDTKRHRLLVFLFTAGTERLKTSPVGRAEMTDLGFF